MINASPENASALWVDAGNAFHHLVASYDGSLIKLYIDGFEVASVPSTSPLPISTANLDLGTAPGGGSFFEGWIDEVAIYASALDAARIKAHYAAAQ
jgi:hypothetical protein